MSNEHDDKLMADATKLAKDIAPRRDLWPDIEAAISNTQQQRRVPWLAQAAAVVLLVAGSSLVTYWMMRPEVNVSPVALPAGGYTLESASFGGGYEMSDDYKFARERLRTNLDSELARLSPEVRHDVEQNLQVIRNAIAEINAALENEPDNVLLQELLLDTYREELAVMKKVGGLTQNVMSRNDI